MNRPLSRRLLAAFLLTFGLAASAPAQDTQRQFLSGHDKDDAIPWKFQCTSGPQSGFWTNLPVPSHWEMHGFGSLNYSKDPTNAWNEHGLYEHDFTIPASWSDHRVFLVFDGVMTDTRATLNGESVGPVHQGSFYRFRYEVTKLAKFGAVNHLAVDVAKHSANNSVNNAERKADYWVFGGIFRPVYLEAVPPQFITRTAIDARADGSFTMDVFTDGVTDGAMVEAQIFGLDGNAACGVFTQVAGGKATLKETVLLPHTWTAETPNLYRVEVRLKLGPEIVHRVQQRFGFRTMEVRDGDGFYVNGHRVILQGADRHSFWPDSGRCLSETVHRLDINVMKDANMNAVRMSHYPPDEQFLDLCDELGLYVLDELGGWHGAYDNDVGPKLVAEMVQRDVNHPCILFWDNGNEGGWNTNLDGLFAPQDPQGRRVLHPQTPFSGVNASHYLAYDLASIAAQGIATHYKSNREFADTNDPVKYIYMPTEFMHGLYDGGAGAGLEDYWNMMRQGKYLGGGFIWALTDDGVKRPDNGTIDVAGNQAPDGIVGPYRQKEGSYYTIKELWSPIMILPGDPPLPGMKITVANRYSFTDARQCQFTWQLRKFRLPGETAAGFTVLGEGKVKVPSIPPGTTNTVELVVPGSWNQADAFSLRINDPSGRELWTWVWPLAASDNFRRVAAAPSTINPSVSESENTIDVIAGAMRAQFSKQSGFLSGVSRGAQTFSLANGPRPAAGHATLTSITHAEAALRAVITAQFTGDLKTVTWTLDGNGWLRCDYTYTADGPMDFHGVAFDYPEALVKHKRWLGDGPFRVWKNRLPGVSLNVWENDYNNTITGWSNWIYPEFKGCFANVRWLQLETSEGPITAVPSSSCPYVQVLNPEFPGTKLNGKTGVNLPTAGLAFLQAIPPTGSKFKEANTTGPQGQPNLAHGEYTGSVNFYFGKLP